MAIFKHLSPLSGFLCNHQESFILSRWIKSKWKPLLGRRNFSVSEACWLSSKAKENTIHTEFGHKSVMVDEVLNVICPQKNQIILDMTFGAGGHTKSLLQQCPDVTIYALDRDPYAFQFAKNLSQTYSQVIPLLGKFSEVQQLLSGIGVNKVDAVLFDFGASSMQFDNPERGFSISKTSPLDMRMDGSRGEMTAGDVVNYTSEDGLYQIIKKYGEDKKARLIARAIVDSRNAFGRITTTTQLADIIATVYEGKSHTQDKLGRHSHVATKTFQALRIFVNDELNEIYNGLQMAHTLLSPGGVCAAISFHSLEDRIVKRHFHGIDMDAKLNLSITDRYRNPSVIHEREELERIMKNRWVPIVRKSVSPKDNEISLNPRARSAKLRAAHKTDKV